MTSAMAAAMSHRLARRIAGAAADVAVTAVRQETAVGQEQTCASVMEVAGSAVGAAGDQAAIHGRISADMAVGIGAARLAEDEHKDQQECQDECGSFVTVAVHGAVSVPGSSCAVGVLL
jgi:hypothetical protein